MTDKIIDILDQLQIYAKSIKEENAQIDSLLVDSKRFGMTVCETGSMLADLKTCRAAKEKAFADLHKEFSLLFRDYKIRNSPPIDFTHRRYLVQPSRHDSQISNEFLSQQNFY